MRSCLFTTDPRWQHDLCVCTPSRALDRGDRHRELGSDDAPFDPAAARGGDGEAHDLVLAEPAVAAAGARLGAVALGHAAAQTWHAGKPGKPRHPASPTDPDTLKGVSGLSGLVRLGVDRRGKLTPSGG
jgi:hypothetical protein